MRVQKLLTSEEIDTLIQKYHVREPLIELSEQFGCHRIAVSKILKRHGVYESTSTKLHETKYAKELVAGYSGKGTRW